MRNHKGALPIHATGLTGQVCRSHSRSQIFIGAGQVECLRYLVENDADLNAVTGDGWSCAHNAGLMMLPCACAQSHRHQIRYCRGVAATTVTPSNIDIAASLLISCVQQSGGTGAYWNCCWN